LRESIADQSVDLIYLDPPFNSSASYNVLFKAPSGEGSQAQIEAFEDTWHWNGSAERAFDEVVSGPHSDASIMLRAMRSALGENDMMAYLAMMAVRLIELHRVLKPTGSIYLHCGGRPAASFARRLMLLVSNDTLLRVVRRRGCPPMPCRRHDPRLAGRLRYHFVIIL
jgi:DNA modification methylase